ncbi:MAG: DUF924 domain-containing protein [Xanthobacteraceae bacterium]|nr:MAG: DUF924 domain-containing protein [Xanthobacteraceae bacterium]
MADPLPDAAAVLTFWREAGPSRWWSRDAAFDAEVGARFRALHERARTGALASWQDSDEGLLALVIVLDQFSRNLYRDDARAFATDAEALALARGAIARGADRRVAPPLSLFFYLPFMHSEASADQQRCVELFRAADLPDNLRFAEIHADIIRRFGRFPHRNRALGRATTPEEQAFLDGGGFAG